VASLEWPGGCEDPRVVESPHGGFVATYTAFNGKVPTVFVATSDDLRRWTKHGPALASTPLCAALVEERFDRDRAQPWSPPGPAVEGSTTQTEDEMTKGSRRRFTPGAG
jgi:hypothetical protein